MTRAFSRDPARLHEVRRIVERLHASEETSDVVPPDFLALWEYSPAPLRKDADEAQAVRPGTGACGAQGLPAPDGGAGLRPDVPGRPARSALPRSPTKSDSERRWWRAGSSHGWLEHLHEKVDRIDVVYVCSNGAIAAQNVNRLNVLGEQEFSKRPG